MASRSAIESESSANSGSRASRGREALDGFWDEELRREERDEGRRGVVGREMGRREAECERLVLLAAWGVDILKLAMLLQGS